MVGDDDGGEYVDRTANANSNGICFAHGTNRPFHPNQNYYQYQHFQQQHRLQQQMLPAVEIISDDEDGEKKQSPIARRKQEVVVDKQSETSISNDAGNEAADESEQEIAGNKDAEEGGQNGDSAQYLASNKANLKDDNKEQPTRGGPFDAMEDDISWGGDGQNEYNFGDEGVDACSEGEMLSHVVPEEIMTEGDAKDTEKDSEIQRLKAEQKEADIMVAILNAQLKGMTEEFEAMKTQSQSDREQQQLELKDLHDRLNVLSSELEEKTEVAARLEAQLRSKDVEMESQLQATAAQLKEANEKVESLSAQLVEADKDGNEIIQRQINKYNSMKEEISSLGSKNLRLEQQLQLSKQQQADLRNKLNMAVSKIERYHAQSAATSSTSSTKKVNQRGIKQRINRARSELVTLFPAVDKDDKYHAKSGASPKDRKNKGTATNRRCDKSIVNSLMLV